MPSWYSRRWEGPRRTRGIAAQAQRRCGTVARRADHDDPATGAVALLRSPHATRAEIEDLAASSAVLRSRRLLVLLLAHPFCPRQFAFDVLLSLGWRDQAAVARAPRTAAPIRRQAERKLVERLVRLTSGERRALARLAPRAVVVVMTADPDPRCIEALLENPGMTEGDAMRLLLRNPNPECLQVLLRHTRWGRSPMILAAALRSDRVPRGIVLGLLATLSGPQLSRLARDRSAPRDIRETAIELSRHRASARSHDRAQAPCRNGGGL